MEAASGAHSSLLDTIENRVAGVTNVESCQPEQKCGPLSLTRSSGEIVTETENGGSCSGGARGDEFVFFDFGGDAGLAVVVGFDAHNVAVAADVHVAGGNNLLGKR
jgi:hypothetical protein